MASWSQITGSEDMSEGGWMTQRQHKPISADEPSGRVHLSELDAESRAVLEVYDSELRETVSRQHLLTEIASDSLRTFRTRISQSRANERVEQQTAYQLISETEEREYTDMLASIDERVLRSPVSTLYGPGLPVEYQSNTRVAKLNAYYRDTVWIDQGTVLEDDYDPNEVPPWRHHESAAGAFDDGIDTFTIGVNWLMRFTAPEERLYNFFPTTAEYGSYWVWSDKINPNAHAHFRMTVRASVSPGGVSGARVSAGRLNIDKDQDRVSEAGIIGRPFGVPNDQLHVAEHLTANQVVIIMFTHEFYFYSRGFPSRVDLTFDHDTVNPNRIIIPQGLGPVWCYVS